MRVFTALGIMFLNFYFVIEALVLAIIIKAIMGFYK
jgi:hypothetical protein|tara:strand:+ start:1411 stop:1518 length:108 start_codon:yes stop_codon:yes gene_type:complete